MGEMLVVTTFLVMITMLICAVCGFLAARKAQSENFSFSMMLCAVANAVGAVASTVQLLHP